MSANLSNKGYTIMELLIVVVVIGVLVSIAVPSYKGVLDRTKRAACMANQRSIEIARLYKSLDESDYGSSIADLSDVFIDIGFIGDLDESDLVCPSGGTYLFITNTFEISCSIAEHNT